MLPNQQIQLVKVQKSHDHFHKELVITIMKKPVLIKAVAIGSRHMVGVCRLKLKLNSILTLRLMLRAAKDSVKCT
jgi:hypothetical protein